MGDAAPTRPSSFVEQARRAQIVDAAIEVIGDEGLARATFSRIAARAGISPALISYHFGSKDELFAALANTASSRFEAAIEARVEGAASYVDALRRLVEAHVGLTTGDSPEAKAVMELYASGIEGDGIRPTGAERRGWVDEIESMLRDGQDEGEFADFDPRPLAVAIIAALEAAPADLAARPDADAAGFARELAELFVVAATTRRTRRR
jgi:AcrR family transcriptional regulator